MGLHVLFDITLLSKPSTTHDTLKWFLTCMTTHMLLKVEVFAKTSFTVRTIETCLLVFWSLFYDAIPLGGCAIYWNGHLGLLIRDLILVNR